MPTLKEKFENINLDEIPDHYVFELNTIVDETENFTDEDALPIFEREFNYLYNTIRKKYPTAMRDYVPPPAPAPTAEEIAEKLHQKQLEDERLAKEEAERIEEENKRIEAERIKKEKVDKANALLAKLGKKKPAEVTSE
jgi:hypothetical protein